MVIKPVNILERRILYIKLFCFKKAPKVVSIAYAFLRPFLHERTANKVMIYSHDSEEWKRVLLTYIDADQLPACYGGTVTDPDGNPNCETLV